MQKKIEYGIPISFVMLLQKEQALYTQLERELTDVLSSMHIDNRAFERLNEQLYPLIILADELHIHDFLVLQDFELLLPTIKRKLHSLIGSEGPDLKSKKKIFEYINQIRDKSSLIGSIPEITFDALPSTPITASSIISEPTFDDILETKKDILPSGMCERIEALRDLRRRVEGMREKLDSFQGLPTDVTLAEKEISTLRLKKEMLEKLVEEKVTLQYADK
ncbi:hypothetical protein ADUPG1_007653 [Aduncisulcus paluster]|uniref:Uncharacterized protein n=1 Tax=Aduncisulcus paluster TaxID=2918883 RepID=A0ABQ5KP79_9EUKA|nr:hypothetical protein ADUPG1_007653 [Aduncisulcus paluster]